MNLGSQGIMGNLQKKHKDRLLFLCTEKHTCLYSSYRKWNRTLFSGNARCSFESKKSMKKRKEKLLRNIRHLKHVWALFQQASFSLSHSWPRNSSITRKKSHTIPSFFTFVSGAGLLMAKRQKVIGMKNLLVWLWTIEKNHESEEPWLFIAFLRNSKLKNDNGNEIQTYTEFLSMECGLWCIECDWECISIRNKTTTPIDCSKRANSNNCNRNQKRERWWKRSRLVVLNLLQVERLSLLKARDGVAVSLDGTIADARTQSTEIYAPYW